MNIYFIGEEGEVLRVNRLVFFKLVFVYEVFTDFVINVDFDFIIWRGDLRICFFNIFYGVIDVVCL